MSRQEVLKVLFFILGLYVVVGAWIVLTWIDGRRKK
jgi:hypothetical protein